MTAAVGEHHGERHHVFAHGAVAHGVGAGSARRRHAAECRVGAGIDGEEQAGVVQCVVELLARDARLHHGIEVFGMNGEHGSSADRSRQMPPLKRQHVAFDRLPTP